MVEKVNKILELLLRHLLCWASIGVLIKKSVDKSRTISVIDEECYSRLAFLRNHTFVVMILILKNGQ